MAEVMKGEKKLLNLLVLWRVVRAVATYEMRKFQIQFDAEEIPMHMVLYRVGKSSPTTTQITGPQVMA